MVEDGPSLSQIQFKSWLSEYNVPHVICGTINKAGGEVVQLHKGGQSIASAQSLL